MRKAETRPFLSKKEVKIENCQITNSKLWSMLQSARVAFCVRRFLFFRGEAKERDAVALMLIL
jgi:hypothetical protein